DDAVAPVFTTSPYAPGAETPGSDPRSVCPNAVPAATNAVARAIAPMAATPAPWPGLLFDSIMDTFAPLYYRRLPALQSALVTCRRVPPPFGSCLRSRCPG